jgi:hypothetical protein
MFFCIDCDTWYSSEDDGEWVKNWIDGTYQGEIWICSACIEGR